MLQQTQAARIADAIRAVPGSLPDGRGTRGGAERRRAGGVERAGLQPPRARAAAAARDREPRRLAARRRRPGGACPASDPTRRGPSPRSPSACPPAWSTRTCGAGCCAASAVPDEPRRLQAMADALAAPGLGAGRRAPGPTPRWSSARPSAAPARPAVRRVPDRARLPLARRAGHRPGRRARPRCAARIERTAAPSCACCRRRRGMRSASAARAPRIAADADASVRRSMVRAGSGSSTALERDGLVHRSRRAVRLGAATIGA